ncbi:hypothetical protein [Microbulbifer marinus]|uniref:hypothetical protein n=1 Tax=Microbulbifer marinus TaxID=658218 RepID=UPI0011153D24|nr:hypothetical protein [Microbulbifer marinus]
MRVAKSRPAGFDGPVVASEKGGTKVQAYVKKIPGVERSTLLHVTTYDFGSQLDGLPDDKRGEAAAYYLSQFCPASNGKETHSK